MACSATSFASCLVRLCATVKRIAVACVEDARAGVQLAAVPTIPSVTVSRMSGGRKGLWEAFASKERRRRNRSDYNGASKRGAFWHQRARSAFGERQRTEEGSRQARRRFQIRTSRIRQRAD